MPMTVAPVRDFVAIGAEHSSLGALARAATAAQGYRLSPDPAPEEVSFIRSDQFSFIRQGVPALVVKSGSQARDPAVDVPALQRQFREANYHQPSDDLSLPLDYGTAADLARVNLRIVLDAANAAAAPRWNAGDFFAEKFNDPK
jgi:Zn-dependent M28 family amino/carboxypeptidase